MSNDNVNNPKHYTDHPSGIECIEVTEHMNFCIGSAIKYLWRHGKKDPQATVEDLRKAKWYIEREIQRLNVDDEKDLFDPRTILEGLLHYFIGTGNYQIDKVTNAAIHLRIFADTDDRQLVRDMASKCESVSEDPPTSH